MIGRKSNGSKREKLIRKGKEIDMREGERHIELKKKGERSSERE